VGFDPKAAQFRNVYVVQGNVVCGEINWQDASQQYRGFVPFIYRYGIDVKDESGLRSGKFAAAWMRLCEARPVTSGQRAELPQHQQEDFAQRLRKLKAAGGNEEPAEFRRHYWQDLAEIEQDLDPDRAAEVERKATKENAQAAEEVDKIRKQLGK
jgi:hypothetical protein